MEYSCEFVKKLSWLCLGFAQLCTFDRLRPRWARENLNHDLDLSARMDTAIRWRRGDSVELFGVQSMIRSDGDRTLQLTGVYHNLLRR